MVTRIDVDKFDFGLIEEQRKKFLESGKTPDVNDFALVRATNRFPIHGYHTPDDENTRYELEKSFLSYTDEMNLGIGLPKVASSAYRGTKHFALNELYLHRHGYDFIIIEPLEDHINNKNLLMLGRGETVFDVSREPLAESPNAVYMIPENRYSALIKDDDISRGLKGKKDVVVFKGDDFKAVSMQLYKMGIISEVFGYEWGNVEPSPQFMQGLKAITEKIGRPGIDSEYRRILYLDRNKVFNDNVRARYKRKFFEWFFERFPNERETRISLLKVMETIRLRETEKFDRLGLNRGRETEKFDRFVSENPGVLADMILRIGADKVIAGINEYNSKEFAEFQARNQKYRESLLKYKTEHAKTPLRETGKPIISKKQVLKQQL